MLLKQSTAYTRLFFLVATSDHLSAGTSASPSVSISKAGAAFGAAAGTVTEIANGWYKIALTTADTGTLGDLAYHVTGTAVDPTDFVDQVGVRNTDDLAFPATSGRSLAVDASGRIDLGLWLGAAPSALNSGAVQADVERWANAAVNALIAGRVDANAQVVGDKTAYALSAAGVQAIWDALTSALTTVGSIGKRLADDIDATVSSRATQAQILSDATPFPGARIDAAISSRAAPGAAMALVTDAVDTVAVASSGANEIADALLDRATAVEGFTPRQLLRLFAAVLVGKADGMATGTGHFRDVADTKNRVTATQDVDGNRTAIVLDGT